MVFESGKIHETAFESEGRHLIADGFFSVWGGFSNRFPEFFENLLNRRREARDIFVYGPGFFLVGSHIIPMSGNGKYRGQLPR